MALLKVVYIPKGPPKSQLHEESELDLFSGQNSDVAMPVGHLAEGEICVEGFGV